MQLFIQNSYLHNLFGRNRRSVQSNSLSAQHYPCRPTLLLFSAFVIVVVAASCLSGCVGLANATASQPAKNSTTGPPSITAQPVSQDVAVGQAAVFAVSTAGASPFSYQWLKN